MATDVSQRVFNFSAGPATMPVSVLQRAQQELICLPGCGASVMEISHRDKRFVAIQDQAEARLRNLLAIPDDYVVLFLQGGSRLQFSMIPMNLLRGRSQPAHYVLTGSWGKNAHEEAVKEGPVAIAWDGAPSNFDSLPPDDALTCPDDAAYVYYTSNETIQGVQFPQTPATGGAPLVCDASSDFLSRPLDVARFGLLYACAQKNAGPAGVTVVILRKDLLACSPADLPGYLDYNSHAGAQSMWNTPPTFAVYMLGLVAEWLEADIGGLAAMHAHNQRKAKILYDLLDASQGFYRGHAQPAARSLMNITFRLPDEELEAAFLKGATQRGLDGLKGHRSVGGIRASIYNAMPLEGVTALGDWMREFHASHG